MILIDTDVCIDILRGFVKTITWFEELTEVPSLPGHVGMELMAGTHNKKQVGDVKRLISGLGIFWPTAEACDEALDTYAKYHLSHNLGPVDALIAATAKENGATLYTFNLKHYAAVPEMDVQRPYQK